MTKPLGPNELTPCQKKATEFFHGNKNLFITGYAGTGKSYLLSHFLRNQTKYENIPVLASTGAAAVLIEGRTFHSFFGLGVMRGSPEDVVKKAVSNKNVRYRIQKTEAIIIDEVSMLSGQALGAAEEISRIVRECNSPWGDIRIIVVGDFAQLPPIGDGYTRPWAFLHPVWNSSSFHPVLLKTMIRTDDPMYLHILNEVRQGKLTDELTHFLDSRGQIPPDFSGTRLFPLRNKTESYNLEKLETLTGKTMRIPTKYTGSLEAQEHLKSNAPIPEILYVKKNALVMIRVNDPKQNYVNGTVGKVADWDDERLYVRVGKKILELEKVSFSYLDGDGEVRATATNFPVSLAWATTIHKAQGATLNEVLLDLQSLWEPGQAYVALSRTRSSNDLFISKWSSKSIKSDPAVTAFYNEGCPSDFSLDFVPNFS